MLSTKDHADVFTALLRPTDSLYIVPVPDAGSADPEALAALATEVCSELAHCCAHPDLFSGLEAALQNTASGDRVIVCGSLYLIGYFLGNQPIQ
jgi:dihydrofolate synthase/folylpolyglutamate synthase